MYQKDSTSKISRTIKLFFFCLPSKLLSRILRASHRDLNPGSLKMFYFSFVFWMIVSAGFWWTLAAIAGIDIETCFPALNLTVWELQLDYKNSISALILKHKWPGRKYVPCCLWHLRETSIKIFRVIIEHFSNASSLHYYITIGDKWQVICKTS